MANQNLPCALLQGGVLSINLKPPKKPIFAHQKTQKVLPRGKSMTVRKGTCPFESTLVRTLKISPFPELWLFFQEDTGFSKKCIQTPNNHKSENSRFGL